MSKYISERESARKGSFKQNIDAEEIKKKREQKLTSVRKNKREETLKRKRLGDSKDAITSKQPISIEDIPKYAQQIRSESPDERFSAVVALRRLLSIQDHPPVDRIIGIPNVIPDLLEILARANNLPALQFEAAWALTNIASGNTEQTATLLRHNAVEIFVEKVKQSQYENVTEQCVWALGNIAGDSPQCRDYLLHQNILAYLLQMTDDRVTSNLRRTTVWCISNLCRGAPPPPFEIIKTGVPRLTELLSDADLTIVSDASWAFSYLTDCDNAQLQYILEFDVAPIFTQHLRNKQTNIRNPALRVVGNIATGEDKQAQTVIDAGALPALKEILVNTANAAAKKEVCWALSNIAAGTPSQLQSLIETGVIPPIINELSSGDFNTKKEAAWLITNATSSGDDKQVIYLVEVGAIPAFCQLLTLPDPRLVIVALEGITNILDRGEAFKPMCNGRNPFAVKLEENRGLDYIEALRDHKDGEVYKKASKLVARFNELFDADDSDDENMIPSVDSQSDEYHFGGNTMSDLNF